MTTIVSPRSRPGWRRNTGFAMGAIFSATAAWLAGPAALPASASTATTPPTFTTISTSANPVLVGVHFTVSGTECDRIADVHPTGKLVFRDTTTAHGLGSASLTPDPNFVNCSDASVTDTESLAAGTYRIQDHYVPGGAQPVHTSANASYFQKVVRPKFTNITWTTGVAVPNAHEEGAAVALNNKVYDISGSVTDCSDGGCGALQPAVDVYDPATNTFSSGGPIPNPRTQDPAAVAVGGKIYVLGGTDLSNNTVQAVDVYTPGSGWSTLPAASDLPSGYSGHDACATAIGSNVYYFDPATRTIGTLNTAASPPSWTESAAQPLLSPTTFCSAVAAGGLVIVVGPGNGSADPNSQRVLIYNPGTDSLTLAQGKTVPTAEQSAANLEGTVVVAGGDFNYNAVEGVAPGQGSVTSYSNLPDNRDDAAGGSVVNNKFYIVGGQSTSTTTPDVLIGTPN